MNVTNKVIAGIIKRLNAHASRHTETGADPLTDVVFKSLFNANTILKADSNNTPVPLTVAEQRVVGRITGGNITALTAAQLMTLLLTLGDKEDLHPRLDYTRILGASKPTLVTRGIIDGFSLPIWNAGANVDEELHMVVDVPDWYDEASDVTIHIHCYIDTANNAKRFQLQAEWEHFTVGVDVIPDTDNDTTDEITTGNDSQYMSYEAEITIDYDIDSPNNLVKEDEIHLRLRRIAASQDEIAGEVVITEIGLIFTRNKLGSI